MRLFSYVVARDFGFAPNPFFGVCTLATCKPQIRKHAAVGDWVIGTGSKSYGLQGHLVYALQVAEILTYDQYWHDERFKQKKPNLNGSLKQAFGDNIYHFDSKKKKWEQIDSHHSYKDGKPNKHNIDHDTGCPRVLVGWNFAYWGTDGPKIPLRVRKFDQYDICVVGQGHKCNFPSDLVNKFLSWLQEDNETGYLGSPAEFGK